jgi:hypothetical protein
MYFCYFGLQKTDIVTLIVGWGDIAKFKNIEIIKFLVIKPKMNIVTSMVGRGNIARFKTLRLSTS